MRLASRIGNYSGSIGGCSDRGPMLLSKNLTFVKVLGRSAHYRRAVSLDCEIRHLLGSEPASCRHRHRILMRHELMHGGGISTQLYNSMFRHLWRGYGGESHSWIHVLGVEDLMRLTVLTRGEGRCLRRSVTPVSRVLIYPFQR